MSGDQHSRIRRHFFTGIIVLSIPLIVWFCVTSGYGVQGFANAFRGKYNLVNFTGEIVMATNDSDQDLMTTMKFRVRRFASNKTIKTAVEFLCVSPSLTICYASPNLLVGRLHIDLSDNISFTSHKEFSDISSGGAWKPRDCVSRQRVAIIIPFRDRHTHLEQLQYYLIPVLKRQQLNFRFFVVEQNGNRTFNKGRVMNTAFIEARKLGNFDCFVFHDVDMIPEDDRNMYSCANAPRHMSPAVDKFSYRLPYTNLVGGVLSMKPDVFVAVNGYSNLYWGWGAEDDDMAARMKHKNISIVRPPITTGRYRMIKHSRREINPAKVRMYLLKTVKSRFIKDGLNSVEYKTVFINSTRLYTHIMVDVGEPPKDSDKITDLMAKK